jgi:hypothetical protein
MISEILRMLSMPIKKKEKWFRYGTWLEEYLNPNIEPWDFEHLIQKAFSLLAVEISLSDNSLWTKQLHDTWGKGLDNLQYTNDMGPFNETVVRSLLGDERKQALLLQNQELYFGSIIIRTLSIIKTVNSVLLKIKKSEQSWEITVAQMEKQEPAVWRLLHNYPTIYEKLVNSKGKIKISRTLSLNTFAPIDDNYKYISSFPLDLHSIASKILFDFLFMGGQEYIEFCSYCGRFTVAARKNSKKFCSDNCRTNFRQKPLEVVHK